MRRPSPLPPQLSSVPFTTADALAAGVTPRRLRSTSLATPFRGVRVDAGAPETLLDRCRAYALIMPPGHVFVGPTAAMLSGIPLPMAVERDPRLYAASIDGSRAPRRRGVVGSSTSTSPRLAGVPRLHSARMTAPADTWCQLSSILGLDDLIDDGWWVIRITKRMPRAELISRTARALRERGWQGGVTLSS